jgi:hypothetical protein
MNTTMPAATSSRVDVAALALTVSMLAQNRAATAAATTIGP